LKPSAGSMRNYVGILASIMPYYQLPMGSDWLVGGNKCAIFAHK